MISARLVPRHMKVYLPTMIRRSKGSNSISFGMKFVGLLCFLVLALKLGPAICIDKNAEKNIPVFPPQSLDFPYPRMLHERDVIHYRDAYGQYVTIGSGTFANVTLGELKGSHLHVVIKSFRNWSYGYLVREIRLHRYVEQLGITSILIGLLPLGPLVGNVSLVYEYVTHSKPLDDLLKDYSVLTNVQWLKVCRQIALSLLRLHQHNVLFNDLHQGNVLIQKRDQTLRVYLIDFGFATYKSGKVYTSNYGNLSGYNFIAPEITNGSSTSEATDIFSLGYLFRKIANKIRVTALFHLAYWCLENQPLNRPTLLTTIARLDSILFGVQIFQQMHNGMLLSDYGNIAIPGKEYLILNKDNLSVVSDTYLACSAEFSTISSKSSVRFTNENTDEWTWLTENELFEKCQVPLYALDEHDLLNQTEEDIHWLSRTPRDAIRLGKLALNNQTVIVKEFYKVEFEIMRNEACITGLFAKLNVSPNIIGILIEYHQMNDLAFVQEFYGTGVSLAEFTSVSSGHEWDLSFLKTLAEVEINYDDQDEFFNKVVDSCEYTISKVFINLLTDWNTRTCKLKSYRRILIERISLILIQKMIVLHDSGYLINNFRINNILVNWNDNSIDRLGIDLRFIDFGLTSSIQQGIYLESDFKFFTRFTSLAPEVVHGHKTSRSSDIYSLCYVLYQVMEDYFPSSFLSLSSEKFFTNSTTFENLYIKFVSRLTTRQNLVTADKDHELKDITFHKYHLLLIRCLHNHSSDRPTLLSILSAVSLAF